MDREMLAQVFDECRIDTLTALLQDVKEALPISDEVLRELLETVEEAIMLSLNPRS